MQIDWWTLALQAVNFLVLVWLLQRFLYHPVRRIIEQRKTLAEQALGDAQARQEAADAERAALEADRTALAQERQSLLKSLHEEADAERAKLLEKAQAEAEALREEARAGLAQERDAALADVRQQAAATAVALAEDLLRRLDGDATADAVLAQTLHALESLPEPERRSLAEALAPADAVLTVTTAQPVPEEAQAQWRDRLAACLDTGAEIRFDTDPQLIGGADLHFPHAVVGHSWARQLEAAQAAMLDNDNAA